MKTVRDGKSVATLEAQALIYPNHVLLLKLNFEEKKVYICTTFHAEWK